MSAPNRAELLNAPARLSDLHGDERTAALAARYRAATDNWWQTRTESSEPMWKSVAVCLAGCAAIVAGVML